MIEEMWQCFHDQINDIQHAIRKTYLWNTCYFAIIMIYVTLYNVMNSQNTYHFADIIFIQKIFNEKFCILIYISQKFGPKGQVNNKSPFV